MLKRYKEEAEYDGSGGKRMCIDKVSRVLHVRNVSPEVTERDIANLAISFGLIKYLVLTRKTGQSLMEMAHEESARSMVDYYAKYPAQFHGKNIIIQYSRYETLSGKGMHPDADNAVKNANDEVRKLCENEPKLVLHVSVDNWDGPRLGHLHFYKLFHRFGNVSRIVVFLQNPAPQALIEMENEVFANVAKLQLSGTQCFYGNVLRIDFSNRKTLDIKHESDTGRDYTISPVSKDELNVIPNFNQMSRNPNLMSPVSNNNQNFMNDFAMRANFNFGPMNNNDALNMLQPLLQQAVTNPAEALPMLQSLAPALSNFLNQNNMNNMCNMNNMNSQGSPIMNDNRSIQSNRSNLQHGCSPVLIIDNLNEDQITPDALFILFGSYGDVLRVKILFNKKSTALVQFVDSEQAGRAIQNLNNVTLYGKPMKINFSKHQNISMPKPDEQNSLHLNRDYSNSKLHRFKRVTPRTLQNIYAPGLVLHVAGLPEKFRDGDVRTLFESEGFPVVKIKLINPNDKKMALVQLESVEASIEALIKMHDFNAGSSHLRVSFSKGFIAN